VQTLIVVVVVIVVLAVVVAIVQFASRPPKDERHWDSGDSDADYESDGWGEADDDGRDDADD
jgi:uncharacterized membrane protein